MQDLDIEFNAEKGAANLAKHGVSLAFGAQVFEDAAHVILATIRSEDGEDRFKVIGMVDGNLWIAVHVYRGPVVRFLSVRRANSHEQRAYDSNPGRS